MVVRIKPKGNLKWPKTYTAFYRIYTAFYRQNFLLGLKTNRVSFSAKSEISWENGISLVSFIYVFSASYIR